MAPSGEHALFICSMICVVLRLHRQNIAGGGGLSVSPRMGRIRKVAPSGEYAIFICSIICVLL